MTSNTERQSDIIAKVENFIRRVHDRDYIITEKAHTIIFSEPKDSTSMFGSRKEVGNLADLLAKSMSLYQVTKEVDKESTSIELFKAAAECLSWINEAFSWNIVKESEGLVNKLKKCEEKNSQLEKDIQELTTEYIGLQGKYAELDKLVQRFSPAKPVSK
jgi:hypothetical protein